MNQIKLFVYGVFSYNVWLDDFKDLVERAKQTGVLLAMVLGVRKVVPVFRGVEECLFFILFLRKKQLRVVVGD